MSRPLQSTDPVAKRYKLCHYGFRQGEPAYIGDLHRASAIHHQQHPQHHPHHHDAHTPTLTPTQHYHQQQQQATPREAGDADDPIGVQSPLLSIASSTSSGPATAVSSSSVPTPSSSSNGNPFAQDVHEPSDAEAKSFEQLFPDIVSLFTRSSPAAHGLPSALLPHQLHTVPFAALPYGIQPLGITHSCAVDVTLTSLYLLLTPRSDLMTLMQTPRAPGSTVPLLLQCFQRMMAGDMDTPRLEWARYCGFDMTPGASWFTDIEQCLHEPLCNGDSLFSLGRTQTTVCTASPPCSQSSHTRTWAIFSHSSSGFPLNHFLTNLALPSLTVDYCPPPCGNNRITFASCVAEQPIMIVVSLAQTSKETRHLHQFFRWPNPQHGREYQLGAVIYSDRDHYVAQIKIESSRFSFPDGFSLGKPNACWLFYDSLRLDRLSLRPPVVDQEEIIHVPPLSRGSPFTPCVALYILQP